MPQSHFAITKSLAMNAQETQSFFCSLPIIFNLIEVRKTQSTKIKIKIKTKASHSFIP